MTAPHEYPGGELELFRKARNWKAYLAAQMRRYVRGDVLEVGAGLGAMTAALCRGDEPSWLCLEPDSAMARRLAIEIDSGCLPANCVVREGVVPDLPEAQTFDTILYIDVLEHIVDDGAELASAARRLKPGGSLVVMSPAHQALFGPFDESIGHHRRYVVADAARLAAPGLRLVCGRYLDSVGLLASLANRLLIRTAMPTERQIWLWDRIMVPVSRALDRLLGYGVGKSVLLVWRRP